ncbi:MAG: threonine ammonia-lyase, partial [Acidobacteriaceae bacterium]
MIPYEWLEQAGERITPHIQRTPLTFDPRHELFLKFENHQVTGSFKARGALNKILALQDWELERGLVTASAGNHGQGVALAAGIRHAHVTVFVSEHASMNKIQAMRALGAEIHLVPGGYAEAESAGIAHAKGSGATWISPYNDGLVI